jgi:S1-C subfamily serine protease
MFELRCSLRPQAWVLMLIAAVLTLTSTAVALSACGGQGRSTSDSSADATTIAAASASGANAVQQRFVAVIKQTQPQVVQIQTDSGLGSGVIFDRKGNIVTNAHVVSGASQLVVTLADGRRFNARSSASLCSASASLHPRAGRSRSGGRRPATVADPPPAEQA